MTTIGIWLIGLLFFGLGSWILLLQIGGLADLIRPHSLSIGQITIDGQEGRGYAELLRARYDYHLRRPASLAIETGFLGIVTLDTPELFQPKSLDAEQKGMNIEVKGVDVPKLIRLINQLFQPDQWIIEGDFQTHSDRVLLILRLRRGERIIRTWYLDRYGDPSKDKSKLLEQLVDDAIFQVVYDFGNAAERNPDLLKWRSVVKVPTSFPNRESLSAYYEALGALGRYYAHGDWNSLNRAVDCLQTLRGLMPKYEDGLQLLGMGLVEKRNDIEAIHVYEQLQLLWKDDNWADLSPQRKRRQLSIDLLKATARAKLYTWQSTHEAIHELLELHKKLQPEYEKLKAEQRFQQDDKEVAAYSELLAYTDVQLAYTYSLYLSYMRHYMVADIFRHPSVPKDLEVTRLDEEELRKKDGKPKPIVIDTVRKIAGHYEKWIKKAKEIAEDPDVKWGVLVDCKRRKAEFVSRLQLTSGYANYRMAELENSSNIKDDTILGETFDTRLKEAEKDLRRAEATHPNHYLSLQLLGLVYSEPRRKGDFTDLSIAEQYFERAILANPSDYYGHELLADVLYRRAANGGVDMMDRAMIDRGLAEAKRATVLREFSGTAYLLQAEFQTMLLSIERDSTRRQELRKGLKQYLDQAKRFLPRTYEANPDLMWVSIVADTLQLGEDTLSATSASAGTDSKDFFKGSKQEVIKKIDELTEFCIDFEQKWVAHQRVFEVQRLGERAKLLRSEIEKATLADWYEIPIPFR
ncbi:MAG: hypothetical protein KKC76_18870 [Proteobacteria bacterium]|nr:hypothetical protein [Pseudomonadota bacterium]MBU4296509.1 hypothetical protein [Pseudomonadota bacterium]MCG2746890.1 hypothetical protein [Desulfobulbaceae bacterium]